MVRQEFGGQPEEKSIAQLRLLVSSELSVKVRAFVKRVMENDLENSKKLGWNNFREFLLVMDDYNQRNFLRILSALELRKGLYHYFSIHSQETIPLCPSCRTRKVSSDVPSIAHAVEADVRPWMRPSIYLPFLEAVQAGPQAIFNEGSADVLSAISYSKGSALERERRPTTGLFDFIRHSRKKEAEKPDEAGE